MSLNKESLLSSDYLMANSLRQWLPRFVRLIFDISFSFIPGSSFSRWRSSLKRLLGSWVLYTVFLFRALKKMCFLWPLLVTSKICWSMGRLCGLASKKFRGVSILYLGCRPISVLILSLELFSILSSVLVLSRLSLSLSGINLILNLLARLMY